MAAVQEAFTNDEEPPAKRLRFAPDAFKKRRVAAVDAPDPYAVDAASSCVPGQILSSDSLWHEAFKMAYRLAPRVGNLKMDVSHDLCELVQQLTPEDFEVDCMFICRGTDRYQIPLSAPVSKDAPWCYTLCAHRVTGEIHDLGLRGMAQPHPSSENCQKSSQPF